MLGILHGLKTISVVESKMHNNELVNAPAGLGQLNFARSSLRFTAPQQKRYA